MVTGVYPLKDLLVTQNGLRNCRQVARMIEFVRRGGYFSQDARLAQAILTDGRRQGVPPPMFISHMEDGRLVLHDGHHRAVAMFLGGRDHVIGKVEADYGNYTYADYSQPNPEMGWFTPFDIDTEVRLPDFGWFKGEAQEIYKQYGLGALKEFTTNYHSAYAEPRRLQTVAELAEVYQRECPIDGRRKLRIVR
jgi:hypothetical protein